MLVFAHIPKTGGRALARGLHAKYQDGFFYPKRRKNERYPGLPIHSPKSSRDVAKWIESLPSNARCVAGHIVIGASDYLECREAVVLRDPVERLVSLYSHKGRGGSPDFIRSIHEFFEQGRVNPELRETQTRVLAGVGIWSGVGLTDEDRERALSQLGRVRYLGVSEKLSMFGASLGIDLDPVDVNGGLLPHEKKYADWLSEESLELARHIVGFDMVLYARALELCTSPASD